MQNLNQHLKPNPFTFLSREFGSFSNNDSYSTTGTEIEGNSSIEQYILGGVIGQGSFGRVQIAIDKETQAQFAAKAMIKDELKRKRQLIRDEKGKIKYKSALDSLHQEIAIMKQLSHPNIVKLHDVIQDIDSPFIYILMEYLKGGQIMEWDDMKKEFYNTTFNRFLPEDKLRTIFIGVINGLEYLHENGIIHRDIKPQNILQDEYGTPKIADFGSAVQLPDSDIDTLTTNQGTQAFMAPETFADNMAEVGYSGKAADIWSMGVTFFGLTFNRLPFYNADVLELCRDIESKQLEFPTNRFISRELRGLLEGMLEKDPKKRINMEQLKRNPWLLQNKYGFESGESKKGFEHPKDRFRRCMTLQEKNFEEKETDQKEEKKLRRTKTCQFDKLGQPQKKVHGCS